MPELISHLAPARIVPARHRISGRAMSPRSCGIKLGRDGTHGKGIGPNLPYEVKFGDGTTKDLKERFVGRPMPKN